MEYHPIRVDNPDRSVSFLSEGVLYQHVDEYGTVPLRLPRGMPFSSFAVEHTQIFPDIGRILQAGSEHVRGGNVNGAEDSLSTLLQMNEGTDGEALGLPNAMEYAQALMSRVLRQYVNMAPLALNAVAFRLKPELFSKAAVPGQ